MDTHSAPQTIEEFEDAIRHLFPSLPKRMKQCAEHLLQHKDRIAVSTVAELAAGAGVQPSAMMRFCQVLGFAGFSEMQRMFRDAYTLGLPDYATRLANLRDQGADSPSALLAEFVEAGTKSLETLVSTVDPRDLDRAVSILAEASVVHLVGLRRAFPVASYLEYAFEKMKIASILHDGIGKLDRRETMRPGDAVIAITFAPYTPETIALAEEALARGLPVVAITDRSASPLHRAGTLVLQVNEIDFDAFRSLSATLTLAITLAVSVGARRNSK